MDCNWFPLFSKALQIIGAGSSSSQGKLPKGIQSASLFSGRVVFYVISGGQIIKAGSLWVAWMDIDMLKGRSFYSFPITASSPYSWREISKLRKLAKPLIEKIIGTDNNNFLRHDH